MNREKQVCPSFIRPSKEATAQLQVCPQRLVRWGGRVVGRRLAEIYVETLLAGATARNATPYILHPQPYTTLNPQLLQLSGCGARVFITPD